MPNQPFLPAQWGMQPFLRGIVLAMLGLWALAAHATHNRAGEITYTHVAGFTYEVVITTYTAVPPRTDLSCICGGDEPAGVVLDSLARELPVTAILEEPTSPRTGAPTPTGPGVYAIQMESQPQRGCSEHVEFGGNAVHDQSLLVIDPQAGHNSSAQLLNPARKTRA